MFSKGAAMTTIEVTLPDQLAKEAEEAGLLSPEPLEALLREQLRKRRVDGLFSIIERSAASDPNVLTPEQVSEELRAMRAEERAREHA